MEYKTGGSSILKPSPAQLPATRFRTPTSAWRIRISKFSIQSPRESKSQHFTKSRHVHHPTAFDLPFDFFTDFPREIRDQIYRYLAGELFVIVDADGDDPSVKTFQVKPQAITRSGYSTAASRSWARPKSNWLCLSKQFFHEFRSIFQREMVVQFQRRWDFIGAFINGSLSPDQSAPTQLTLFPQGGDVFSNIKELHLDLTRSTDFDGRVHITEARRVTTQMLQIIKLNMPRLTTLCFTVDHRSRLSTSIMVFVPDYWFLEALLAIKHVKHVTFVYGPEWAGYAQNKRNARACIIALNHVLQQHSTVLRTMIRIDAVSTRGRRLKARVTRMMLHYFSSRNSVYYNEVVAALSMQIVLLESIP